MCDKALHETDVNYIHSLQKPFPTPRQLRYHTTAVSSSTVLARGPVYICLPVCGGRDVISFISCCINLCAVIRVEDNDGLD